MSDDAFFAELQSEFIIEALFLLENYEEHMLGLESEENRPEHLTQIFRVAHSIKGGASAVGFPDLGVFAHKVEDLLAILRVTPTLTNSEIISVLLKAGDEFKKRLHQLKEGESAIWDPAELRDLVVGWTNRLTGLEHPAEVDKNSAEAPEEEDMSIEAIQARLEAEEQEALLASKKPADVIPLETVKAKTTSNPIPASPSTNSPPKKSSHAQAPTSIKVDLGRVDSVLDAVGEIVVLKNQLVHDDSVKNGNNPRLAAVVDQLDKSVRELYEKTLGIRMTPLKSLFLKIQRIVRDVSLQLDKPVDLQILGDETEVERTVFEMLGDPMVHLVRNALDHGIEKQETRKSKGKSLMANLMVSARQSGGQVIIEIKDDGGGIDRERVLAKALEKGLLPSGHDTNSMTDNQVYQLLMAPGFSTAEKVSDLSGRGVGLDVVKSNLERVHGKIEIESKLGAGSTFRLVIPLTTAITDGIVVALNNRQYILPTYSIKEIVRVAPEGFTKLSSINRVVKIRDSLLSVIELGNLFSLGQKTIERTNSNNRRDEQMLVIIETVHGQSALPVDDVLGQTQAVVKPFQIGEEIPEISGAAVLGDGSTVLILDPQTIARKDRAA